MLENILYFVCGMLAILALFFIIFTLKICVRIKRKKIFEVTIKDKWGNADLYLCERYKIKKNKLYLYNVDKINSFFKFLVLKTFNLTYVVNYEIVEQ